MAKEENIILWEIRVIKFVSIKQRKKATRLQIKQSKSKSIFPSCYPFPKVYLTVRDVRETHLIKCPCLAHSVTGIEHLPMTLLSLHYDHLVGSILERWPLCVPNSNSGCHYSLLVF